MSWGLETFDEFGVSLVSSPHSQALYPVYHGAFFADVDPPSGQVSFGVAAADADISCTVSPSAGSGLHVTSAFPGHCESGAYYKSVAAPRQVQGSVSWGATASVASGCVLATKTDPASGFGLAITNEGGKFVVDGSNAPLYFTPAPDGTFVRTATVRSAALATRTQVNSVRTLGFPIGTRSVIPLSAPTYKPPLLWVLDSGGAYVAFDGYQKDGSGRYTGVSVVTPRTTRLSGTSYFYLADVETVANITFVLTSFDPPQKNAAFGVEVFDAAGSEVFSTECRVPVIRGVTAARPYVTMNGFSRGGNPVIYRDVNYLGGSSHHKIGREAVCINNFAAHAGMLVNSCHYYSGSNIDFYRMVAAHPYGRFVKVGSDSFEVAPRLRSSGDGDDGWILPPVILSLDGNHGAGNGSMDVMVADCIGIV